MTNAAGLLAPPTKVTLALGGYGGISGRLRYMRVMHAKVKEVKYLIREHMLVIALLNIDYEMCNVISQSFNSFLSLLLGLES